MRQAGEGATSSFKDNEALLAAFGAGGGGPAAGGGAARSAASSARELPRAARGAPPSAYQRAL